MEAFVSWARSHGVDTSAAVPVETPGAGWELAAGTALRVGELALAVPDKLIVGVRTVLAQRHYEEAVARHVGVLNTSDLLCVFLARERAIGAESTWAPYLRVLPASFELPVAMGDRFPSTALPPDVQRPLEAQHNDLRNSYRRCNTVWEDAFAGQLGPLSWHEFVWCWCCVNTRCIHVEDHCRSELLSADAEPIALVPYFDFANHSADAQVSVGYSGGTRSFRLHVSHGAAAGAPIAVSYGPHDNDKLLLEYGFTLADNANNRVVLAADDLLELSCATRPCGDKQLVQRRAEAVRRLADPCYIYETQAEPPWHLLAACKVLTMSAEQLKRWHRLYNDKRDLCCDVEALGHLVDVLSSYRCMLQSDYDTAAERLQTCDASIADAVSRLWQDRLRTVGQCIGQASALIANTGDVDRRVA